MTNTKSKRLISGIIYVIIMWFCTSLSKVSFHSLFILILCLSAYEMWKLRKEKNKLFPFIYLLLPFSIVHLLNQETVLIIFILTWTFDTFAYLLGIKFGKNKIKTSISPKKSWEGFFGGYVCTILITYILNTHLSYSINFWFSFIIPITATLGDFIESYYKRQAKVKDSGNLIPGHGGLLDRIDALTITIPIIYFLKLQNTI